VATAADVGRQSRSVSARSRCHPRAPAQPRQLRGGACGAAGLPRSIDRAKQLWNIPFNLVAGPGLVSNNPGEGFDASYRSVVDKDQVRRFVETDVSRHLRAVERYYREDGARPRAAAA